MERQIHGFHFQDKIAELYEADSTGYTDHWDFVKDSINYSVKNIKDKGSVELGSLKRFYANTRSFSMILARHTTNIISVDVYNFSEDIINELKGSITLEEVEQATNMLSISNFPIGQHEDARKYFKEWKAKYKNKMGLLTFTGKVDSKSQRRWQCNINYTNWLTLFGKPSYNTVLKGYDFK